MYFLTISFFLFSNLFIQISTSEEASQPFYTKKIDIDNNVWTCFREVQTNIKYGLNDQSPERLVVYLYKNPVTKEIKAFVPGPDKQALVPNFPTSVGDTLKPVTTEHIASLFNSEPDASHVSTKGAPIGWNQGKIKTINFNPADTESFSNQLPPQNQNTPPVDLPSWTYNDEPQYYPGHQVPQNLYPQFYLQDGYPTYDYNFGSNEPQEIYLNNDVKYTTESDAHIKNESANKTQDKYTLKSTSKPETMQLNRGPETKQTGLPSVKPEVYSPGNSNKYLTFDQWFTKQIKTFQDASLPDDVKGIDSDLLRSLVQKTLFENQLIIGSTGMITDAEGIPINLQNLGLRPILIGNSFDYTSLQGNQQIKLPQPVPYLEGILVTLVYPPKILGVIPLGKTYVSKPSPVISQVKETKYGTPALIKRYYTDSGSTLGNPSNPSIPVTSSSKKYHKGSSALNPFSVTGSLSSSVKLPFLPNLYSKSLLSSQLSGVGLRRSNTPKEGEKLKNKAEKLKIEATKLEQEATKLKHDAKQLETEVKKKAKKLEHKDEKLEKEAKKDAKKLKKEVKKLKKHAEKCKANEDWSTSCSEPNDKPPSEPKPPVGPKPESGPYPPLEPKLPAVSKSPADPKLTSRPKSESGPHIPPGPKPLSKPKKTAEPKPPAGPKPELRPHSPSGPRPETEPHPPSGPKLKSGPQPPPGPKPEAGPHPPLDLKPPSEPKSLPVPKPESGTHPPPESKPEPGSHPPLDLKPDSESHPQSGPKSESGQSKPESESENSYRRLGTHDLPSYNLDWDRYHNSISYQGFGQLPASKLKDIWGESFLGSNTPAESKSDSHSVKYKFNGPLVYRRVIYPDTHHKFDSNANRYLTAIPYYGKRNFPYKPNNNHPQLVVTPIEKKWNQQEPEASQLNIRPLDDDQNEAMYPYTQDSNSLHLIATPLNSKSKSDSKINHKPSKWGDHQNDEKYKYPLIQENSSPHLIATSFNNKWNSDSKINHKPPKWADHQNDGKFKYPSTQDSNFPHLIATPFNSKWNSYPKINHKSPKWGDHQNDGKYKYPSTHVNNSPQLIGTPFNSKWNSDSKINNKSPKWGDHPNDGSSSTQNDSYPRVIATPFSSKWKSDSKINNKSPKWGNHQNDGSTATQDNSYPRVIASPFYSKWNSGSKINNKSPKWGDLQNDGKFNHYPTQYMEVPKMDSNSQRAAYIAAHKNAPNSYNPAPERNPYSTKSNNPDVTIRSGLGSPYWHPGTTPRPNTRRPKSPVNNVRRTYDQLSAEIGTEESIEDFQHGNFENIQNEVEETPSRRFDFPVQNVLKSLLNMVWKNFMIEISGGGGNRRKADEPIDINATATNPIQIEGEEDDHRDFRIIGGSAATGSGSPLSNKGRSGINFRF